MKIHEMKLKAEPFYKIKSGIKRYELRLYDEKRRLIQVGDRIEFTKVDSVEKCNVLVTGLHRFDSFTDLYTSLPIQDLGYAEEEVSSADPNDMGQYYTAEQQQKFGVVAIGIEILPD